MNKALINKYWKEFCHWKDGGEICIKDASNTWISTYYPDWEEPTFLRVINDEYVEYRKALAEGKIVEFKLPDDDWVSLEIDVSPSKRFSEHIDYRIKPDEPKFKVDDYVITTMSYRDTKNSEEIALIKSISENGACNLIFSRESKAKGDYCSHQAGLSSLKLWALEEADDDELVFVKVNGLHGRFTWCLETKDSLVHKYEDCEYTDAVPYIGQTPKQLGLKK